MKIVSLRHRIERLIYSAYRARVRRSQRPELPADVPDDLALPAEAENRTQSRTVTPWRRAAVVPVSILASSLLLTFGGGLYIGHEFGDPATEPRAAAIEAQTQATERRVANDVCLARLQAREDGDAGIFDAARDSEYQRCTAEREADVARITADAQ